MTSGELEPAYEVVLVLQEPRPAFAVESSASLMSNKSVKIGAKNILGYNILRHDVVSDTTLLARRIRGHPRATRHVGKVPIVLQKSFCRGCQKF
jgi:hypothetical protein